jgi:hypothetical protein
MGHKGIPGRFTRALFLAVGYGFTVMVNVLVVFSMSM